jgi:hypothetical protein
MKQTCKPTKKYVCCCLFFLENIFYVSLKKKDMKTNALFIISLFFSLMITAQSDSISSDTIASFEVELTSRYVWRGQDIGGNVPYVHPYLELSTGSEKHNVIFSVWGAYALGKSKDEELTFLASYVYDELLELTISDYFLYDGSPSGYDLFNFSEDETPHVLEAMFGFLGTEKIPISLHFAMMFYGNDARKIQSDGSEGGILYSKYIELAYEMEKGASNMKFFLGIAPDKVNEDRGEETYYATTQPGVVNVGVELLREIKISSGFSCDMKVSFITNPVEKSAFLIAAIVF